jgi:hypothetical protein
MGFPGSGVHGPWSEGAVARLMWNSNRLSLYSITNVFPWRVTQHEYRV